MHFQSSPGVSAIAAYVSLAGSSASVSPPSNRGALAALVLPAPRPARLRLGLRYALDDPGYQDARRRRHHRPERRRVQVRHPVHARTLAIVGC